MDLGVTSSEKAYIGEDMRRGPGPNRRTNANIRRGAARNARKSERLVAQQPGAQAPRGESGHVHPALLRG